MLYSPFHRFFATKVEAGAYRPHLSPTETGRAATEKASGLPDERTYFAPEGFFAAFFVTL
jgi:hypothetical protein